MKIRNVKGDVNFTASCDGNASVEELRTAVVAAAPKDTVAPGAKCTLVHKGKILSDSVAKLASCSITDGAQVIMVIK